MESKERVDTNLETPEVRLVKYQALQKGVDVDGSIEGHFTLNTNAQYSNEAFQNDNENLDLYREIQQRDLAKNNDKVLHSFYDANLANDKFASSPVDLQKKSATATEDKSFIIGVDGDDYQRNVLAASPQQPDSRPDLLQPGSFEIVWRELSFEVDETATFTGSIRQLQNNLVSAFCCSSSSRRNAPSSHNELKSNVDIERMKETSSVTSISSDLSQTKQTEAKVSSSELSSRTSNRNIPNKHRVIFKHLNGYIRSGEVTAILGPSGAGKTSLLNALTGKTVGYQGQVDVVGGQKRKMRMSIIPQKDYLLETLTVKENLLFASKIKNHKKDFDHEANIAKVIDMLNLQNCVNAMSGNISGGEHKRVSIAQELLSKPDLLILDEPTSGLDSLNCKKLILTLKDLIQSSNEGLISPIAIVMTIHQPEVDVYHLFDHVYFMARQGRVIFDGPPQDALSIVRQFSGIDDSITDSVYSPANYLIEIASEEYGQDPINNLSNYQRRHFHEERDAKMNSLRQPSNGKFFKRSIINPYQTQDNSVILSVGELKNNHLEIPITGPAPPSPERSTRSTLSSEIVGSDEHKFVRDKRLNAIANHSGHFWRHVRLLAKRAFVSTLRDPLLTTTTALFHLVIPFVMYSVYSPKTGTANACPIIQREMDTMTMISNETSQKLHQLQEDFIVSLEASTMFFLIVYAFSMCTLSIAALSFPLNMHITLKEYKNGWYSMSSYVVARTVANIPFETIFPMISLCIAYPLLGHPSSYLQWRMFTIALVTAFISMIATAQGLIFGAIFMDSVQSATFMANASTLPLVLLSGFTARINHMPIFLQYISWGSMYKYASDAMSIVRFGYGQCPCDEKMDKYIREVPPRLNGIPDSVKAMFNFYLINGMADRGSTNYGDDEDYEGFPDDNSSNVTNSLVTNATSLLTEMVTTVAPSWPSGDSDMLDREALTRALVKSNQVIVMNSTMNDALIKQIEDGKLDVFQELAGLFSRALAYGEEINSCEDVRSQLLKTGIPPDHYLPYIFGCMVCMLITLRFVLFIVIKFKIQSRV